MKNIQSKLPKIIVLSILTAFSLNLNGCAVPKMRRSPYFQNTDLTGFHKHEYAKNFIMYSKPDGEWLKYNKFMLSPALISINPTLEYQHISPTALKLASDILIEEVQNNLRLEFTETTSTSPNVINIKLALTNMMAPSRDKEIGSMQIGLIPIGLKGAIFEAYFEDALSGELLAVVRDERIGLSSTTNFYKGFSSSNFFHRSFALWGTELCNILLEKTGRERKNEAENVSDEFDSAFSEENYQSKEEYSTEVNQINSDTESSVTGEEYQKEPSLPKTKPVVRKKQKKVIQTTSPTPTQTPTPVETTETQEPLGDDSFKF